MLHSCLERSEHLMRRPITLTAIAPLPPDPSRRHPFSDQIAGGKFDVRDVLQPIYDEINEQYGLNEKPD